MGSYSTQCTGCGLWYMLTFVGGTEIDLSCPHCHPRPPVPPPTPAELEASYQRAVAERG